MGILDNFESSLDFQYESTPIKTVDNTGLALKIFSETCCNGCSCQTSKDHIKEMSSDEEVWNI
jgi:hypothetical protein